MAVGDVVLGRQHAQGGTRGGRLSAVALAERTGDRRWRDRIVRGLDAISASPHGMFSGPGFELARPARAALPPGAGDAAALDVAAGDGARAAR